MSWVGDPSFGGEYSKYITLSLLIHSSTPSAGVSLDVGKMAWLMIGGLSSFRKKAIQEPCYRELEFFVPFVTGLIPLLLDPRFLFLFTVALS